MTEDQRRAGQAFLPSSESPLLENLRLATEAAYEKYLELLQVHGHAVEIYEESMPAPAWSYEEARRNLRAAQMAAIDACNAYERERTTYENVAGILKDFEG